MAAGLIDSTKWLAGYAAYERGEPCPWIEQVCGEDDESCRAGWIAAKRDAVYAEAANGPGGDPFGGLS